MLLGGLMLELAYVRALTVTQAFFSGQRSTIPCVETLTVIWTSLYFGTSVPFLVSKGEEVACNHGITMCI